MNFNNLQSGDWQNFIFLILILIVLIIGLFSRYDMRFMKILKYFTIWVVVGFVIIIAYSYRYEFSDFKLRILSEVNPTSVRTNKNDKMIIRLSKDSHFYVNIKINNVPIRFMVDTGASNIALSIKEAKKIGIDAKGLKFNRVHQTANGKSWGATVVLKKVEIGNVEFKNIPASILNSEIGTPLLGMSFLRKFRKYEFYRDKLILTI